MDCCVDTTAKSKNDPYLKTIKEGGSVREGLFTVRHIKNDWYLEIPDSLLGRMMLAVTRFASVPQEFKMVTGEEVNRSAVYFEQYGDKTIFLREYVQSQYAKPENRIAISLKQSTTDPIVWKFDVIGRNPETHAQLINITKWLMGENKVTNFSSSDRTILGIGSVQSDRTFIDTIKTYPINVEIASLRTYGMSSGRVPAAKTGAATLSLNTSLVLLPREPMQPRYADERVGYFNSKITEFSDDETSNHEAIIMRYRLEPKDPAAYKAGKLVEPKKQIVFYIDPATPKKWAKYLKLGIEDWQKAFEEAGFKNAIVAKDWPKNDSTMSIDDARFSVLRYLPSETENAYGPRIVDPRSGEIIEAHICWYHNVMNLVKKWYMVQCGPLDKRAQKMDFSDELMGQLIRFVSSHEVGHSLGLRHNMIASQATPVEKLRDKAWVEKYGHTASIMDYARFNYVAQPEDKISEKGLFPRINDYDKWAIKWGYQYRPEFKDPAKEKKVLRAETTKVLKGNRRLWWCGDEGKGRDPRSQSEDLGDNQMRANDYGLKNLQRVMAHIEEWTAQPDGQYDDLSFIHRAVRSQYQRYVNHVQKYLFSKYVNNAPGEKPYDIVPRDLQREAVDWLSRNVMEAPMWLYPKSVVSKLGVDYADEIRNRQQTLIAMLLSPNAISNLMGDQFISDKAYPVEEYFDDIFGMVWKPLTDKDEEQNSFRRLQQRSYVDFLGVALNGGSGADGTNTSLATRSDAILYIAQHLDKVENYLQNVSQQQSALNALHYKDLLLRVKKIRERHESGK
ncbi:zinc-dependent metalloprotease [Prevotella communis]|uniref:zinc-dependent metalloprotease n=1 Tax=Prevotella communis TaxID=2913614 RepID=UPI001EDC1748|nr:zinc-dependent metalloprotease [Prevotella communis]UKK69156.1 zinc-dependent metalloprotease [Prevotella communis]UKK71898.1 zinc-dependent metalloprotease [Prevotella communis]